MNSDRTVLVTGATGRQGGAVIRYMLPKGWRLRALVFKADDSTVQRLTDQGIAQMFGWFNQAGFNANIPELRRKYPEVHLQTLEERLRNEGWHKRARHIRAPKG